MSYDQGAIELAPANPQLVYVPVYNPWTVYGDPVPPYPGFSLIGAIGSFFSSGLGPALRFGAGIAMAAFDHTPFGWLSWAVSWLGHEIFFNHSGYLSHSNTVANWGLPRGGMLAFAGSGAVGGGRGGYARAGVAPVQGYARPAERNSYSAPVERAYAPVERYNRPEAQAYNRPDDGGVQPHAGADQPAAGVQQSAEPVGLWAELLQRRRGIWRRSAGGRIRRKRIAHRWRAIRGRIMGEARWLTRSMRRIRVVQVV